MGQIRFYKNGEERGPSREEYREYQEKKARKCAHGKSRDEVCAECAEEKDCR